MKTTRELPLAPFADEETPLYFGFKTLAKTYYGAASKQFEEINLDKYFLLLSLVSKNENMTQQCLAKYFGIDKAMIVRVIDYLSEKGLVKREINPKDRREHRIVATKKTLKFAPKINQVFIDINKAAFNGFTEKEKTLFYDLTNRMLDNLGKLPANKYELKIEKRK